MGPAERVFRLSLHQRFPGPVQTCKECALNSFKMFPERGIQPVFETICTLTTAFLNCTNVLFSPVVPVGKFLGQPGCNVVLKGVTVSSGTSVY